MCLRCHGIFGFKRFVLSGVCELSVFLSTPPRVKGGKSSAALLAAAGAHAGALGHETNIGSRKGKTKRDSPGKSYSKSPQLTGFQNDLTATS